MLILIICLIALENRSYFIPEVNIQMSDDVLQLISIEKCFWQNDGEKYKCRYKNISGQELHKSLIKATAFDKDNRLLGMLNFPKYNNIPVGHTTRESIAKIKSKYEITRIFLERSDSSN